MVWGLACRCRISRSMKNDSNRTGNGLGAFIDGSRARIARRAAVPGAAAEESLSAPARTIIGWYRSGKDPAREMIKLTTYLGHVSPDHTYWYIEAVPELLELASARITEIEVEEARQ